MFFRAVATMERLGYFILIYILDIGFTGGYWRIEMPQIILDELASIYSNENILKFWQIHATPFITDDAAGPSLEDIGRRCLMYRLFQTVSKLQSKKDGVPFLWNEVLPFLKVCNFILELLKVLIRVPP